MEKHGTSSASQITHDLQFGSSGVICTMVLPVVAKWKVYVFPTQYHLGSSPMMEWCSSCENKIQWSKPMWAGKGAFKLALPGYIPSLRKVREKLKAGTRAEAIEEHCFLPCSLVSDQFAFLDSLRLPAQRWYCPLTPISNQENPNTYTHRSILSQQSPNRGSGLCQVDREAN